MRAQYDDFKEGLRSVTGRVCLVLFLDVLAFSIVIPILPNLILNMVDGDAGRAAFLQGAASSLDGALKFFMQPFLGRLSDSVGRKPVLAYSLIGSALSFGLYVVAPSIPTLFISHALHGLTQCTFLIAMSSVADAARWFIFIYHHLNYGETNPKKILDNPSDPSSLTHAFGLIGVSLGTAFVLGPILGGALAEIIGFRAIYAMSSLLFIATVLALRWYMIETLDISARKQFLWSEAVPLRSARTVMSRSRGLSILALAYFLCSLTVGGRFLRASLPSHATDSRPQFIQCGSCTPR